jgi:hypothetical protein
LGRLEAALVGAPADLDEMRRVLDATWSSIAHPLANNEWKLDAATGVVTTAIGRALGAGVESRPPHHVAVGAHRDDH